MVSNQILRRVTVVGPSAGPSPEMKDPAALGQRDPPAPRDGHARERLLDAVEELAGMVRRGTSLTIPRKVSSSTRWSATSAS